ncbi:MAG: hypothetical protein ACRCY8_11830 [Dermatophilaceae bacterium]
MELTVAVTVAAVAGTVLGLVLEWLRRRVGRWASLTVNAVVTVAMFVVVFRITEPRLWWAFIGYVIGIASVGPWLASRWWGEVPERRSPGT